MTTSVHARLHRTAGVHLPQAGRPRDRRDGRVRAEQSDEAATRQALARRSRRTRNARPATGSTAPGWPTPRWCRRAPRSSTGSSASGPTSVTGCARRSGCEPADLLTVRGKGARVSLEGVATNISVALRYLAAWVGGSGRRCHRQPDGGRGDRRDLPGPAVAVDPQPHPARRGPAADQGNGRQHDRRRGRAGSIGRVTPPARIWKPPVRSSSRWPSRTGCPASSRRTPTSGT